jgi:hypothetical protein
MIAAVVAGMSYRNYDEAGPRKRLGNVPVAEFVTTGTMRDNDQWPTHDGQSKISVGRNAKRLKGNRGIARRTGARIPYRGVNRVAVLRIDGSETR